MRITKDIRAYIAEQFTTTRGTDIASQYNTRQKR